MAIDLRSDTVTQPNASMRAAMAAAEVGDDIYGDDPTMRRLEEQAAALVGHEASLFATSGTQGNLVALLTHCGRGDGVILGAESHIYYYEKGGMALGGLFPLVVSDEGGLPCLEGVAAWCRDDANVHFVPGRLLCLENTHNRHGGVAVPPGPFEDAARFARDRGLRTHLDGARIFNAAAFHGVDVRAYTTEVDSVQFCLSKGLGAPVGSMLCGSRAFIDRARHWRKALGGGMRQSGVLAAAGIVALDTMIGRLGEDHENARMMASLLQEGGLAVCPNPYPTNMVFVELPGDGSRTEEILRRCRERGVLFGTMGPRVARFVTHGDVSRDEVRAAAAIVREEVGRG